MSLGVALVVLAQLAAADGAAGRPSATAEARAPVATASVRATARIIRPLAVRVERRGAGIVVETPADQPPQTRRDDAGTLWIEFS